MSSKCRIYTNFGKKLSRENSSFSFRTQFNKGMQFFLTVSGQSAKVWYINDSCSAEWDGDPNF